MTLGDKKTESYAARLSTKYKPKSGLQIQNEICKSNSAPLVYTGDSIGITQHWELSGGTITSESGLSKKSIMWNSGGKKIISVYSEIDGCSSDLTIDSVTVKEPYHAEKICMVTVDSATGKNKIIWEKTPGMNTQSYNIYKVFGVVYQPIGNLLFGDLTVFKDFTSIPESMVDRYAISAIDSCGNESAKSPFHQTMLMQASPGTSGNEAVLNWNKYIDESGAWVPEYYYIYKGKTKTSMTLLDSVSGLLETRYNDQTYDGLSAYYQCAIVKKTPCGPADILKAESGPYTQSLSNIVEYKTAAANCIMNSELPVSAYPNPFSENLTVEFSLDKNSDVLIEVINAAGQKTAEFSYKNLASGIRIIHLNAATMNISEGICYIRIIAGSRISMLKCAYVK